MNGGDVVNGVERAARGPWMQRAAAFGFVAKGVVYAVIGIYALQLALGKGGAFLDAKDTPEKVRDQPFGDWLLIALGAGLACHAVWRFVEAFERHPDAGALKTWGKRLASVAKGLVAAFLAVTAFQHLLGRGGDDASWLQRVMRWDGGDWLVTAIGAGFVAGGGYQLYRAVSHKYRKHVEVDDLSSTTRTWLLRICRFGVAARGVVLVVIGYLLLRAGLDVDARQATGTGAALRTIMKQAGGTTLLAIAAAGLIAYALFMLVNARYRRALV
jgi:hypothetical protein